jgi:hypothetical protein
VGAHVGLELYVLSEGRYHPANFPDATIDFRALAWDPTQSRSNYTELAQQALAVGGGTGWLTESSQPAELYGFGGVNPGLSATYAATCRPRVFTPNCTTVSGDDASMPSDGAPSEAAVASEAGDANDARDGGDTGDAGDAVASQAPDAGDDGGDGAVSADAGRATLGDRDAAACSQMVTPCDDLSLAMTGIAAGNLWVTRLRADLPTSALSADLVIEATASQTPVSSLHQTNSYTIANYNPCPGSSSNAAPSPSNAGGCACRTAESPRARFADTVVLCLSAAGIRLSMRRRRRARR